DRGAIEIAGLGGLGEAPDVLVVVAPLRADGAAVVGLVLVGLLVGGRLGERLGDRHAGERVGEIGRVAACATTTAASGIDVAGLVLALFQVAGHLLALR